MIKISCYKTKPDLLPKAFCQLAQKCYYSSTNTCVISSNSDFAVELDRILWTYSRKHFIPHATNQDKFAEDQPIYITDSIENPNNSKIIMLVNPIEENLLELFAKHKQIDYEAITKIIIIFDDNQKIQYSEINSLLLKTNFNNFEINLFEQANDGLWRTIQ